MNYLQIFWEILITPITLEYFYKWWYLYVAIGVCAVGFSVILLWSLVKLCVGVIRHRRGTAIKAIATVLLMGTFFGSALVAPYDPTGYSAISLTLSLMFLAWMCVGRIIHNQVIMKRSRLLREAHST